MRVLLVGNYPPDGQESMQRFAELLCAGLRNADAAVVTLITPPVLAFRLAGANPASHRGRGKWLAYIDKYLLFPFVLWRQARCHELIHICDHSNAVYGLWTARKPWIVTCHDVLAIRSAKGELPDNPTRWSGRMLQNWILSWLKRSPLVACVSATTRADLLRLTCGHASRTVVVHNGLNQPYRLKQENELAAFWREEVLSSIGLTKDSRFILHVGGNQWYKNRHGALSLFASIASEMLGLHLVMAGKPCPETLKALATKLGISHRVHWLGPVSNAKLQDLYHAAEFLLFPSLAEGFGWPVIEAQASGCRVAASNRPPMPEVGGDSCVYLDLDDPQDSEAKLLALLHEGPSQRDARILAGHENSRRFNPEVMTQQYLDLYANLCRVDRTTAASN